MSQPRFESSPARPARVCVVYDQASGAVVHLHQIIALPGAPEATDAELIAEAQELARARAPKGRAKLAALVVDRDTLDRPTTYRVDVRRKTLVPVTG